MDDIPGELNELFASSAPDGLPRDVLTELQSMLRLHGITPQELFYKWESYSMKMGADDTKLDLNTVRLFKRDVQDSLERGARDKSHQVRGSEKRGGVSATPRAGNTDVFGMLDNLTPGTPHSLGKNANGSAKRKLDFETPSRPKGGRVDTNGKPNDFASPLRNGSGVDGVQAVSFADRQNPGQVMETLNSHLQMPATPMAPFPESRIRPTANTDLKKFGYKPMSMRLNEASEILDDRIDEFTEIFEKHYPDAAFGSAAIQSTSEVVTIGRIASDSLEGKLNVASLVLETSRRSGAGRRVPLKVDALPSVQFFPGQIVALKGINASGEYFSVKEVLSPPLLPPAASAPAVVDTINERVGGTDANQPLNTFFAAGPYTTDDNLDFEPLHELCKKAADEYADALVLLGPFLDAEHPLITSGDFDLPDIPGVDPDTATLTTLFHHRISKPLHQLCAAVSSITVILMPSVRDAVSKHVSWPQEQLSKKELGLPKQVRIVSNPVTVSLNECVVGSCAHDILYDLRKEEVLSGRPTEANLLTRLPRYMIEQRHFSPVFPPPARDTLPKAGGADSKMPLGAMMDVSYLKLGEWGGVRPDILVTPSMLPPFVKVIESVLVINPGTLSKHRAAGTYANMALYPRVVADDEREEKELGHKVYERARVDVLRI